jgi:CRP-like cAMP-binding protein
VSDSVVDRLAAMTLLQGVPRQELEWLAAHGEVRTLPAGTVTSGLGQTVNEMWLMFTGRVGFHQPMGGGSRRLMEAVAGQVVGALPYSRALLSPGAVIVDEEVTALVLHRDHFPALIRELPGVTTALVHSMLDRSRTYRSVQLNEERLESLSRLASRTS